MPRPLRDGELELADGSLTPEEISAAIRRGDAPDDAFDRFLPRPLQEASDRYWTPLAVAALVAGWLEEEEVGSVLDIGSGCGKFCVAAATACGARFIGLEQRRRLVLAARNLARIFRVEDRVSFIEGVLGATSCPAVDAYYLYNPFGENFYAPSNCLDHTVELSYGRFGRDIAAVEAMLLAAPLGNCLVTYNGFGGRVPTVYEKVREERGTPSPLCLWRKVRTLPTCRLPRLGFA